ncbi:MAG: hypothetical protein C0497_01010 [Gemmatimonas sp.]|nr:hypothetical protein [Gemmatimonas sp.]
MQAAEVAEIAVIVSEAFAAVGVQATVVGGSALALHLPSVIASNDVDVVLELPTGLRPTMEEIAAVMAGLGFSKESGRHWALGNCLVEFPGGGIEEPVALIGTARAPLRVLSLEAMLVQRLRSFKNTGSTEHGMQAVAIIGAIGDRLDMGSFAPMARTEDVVREYNALRVLALGHDAPTVTVAALLDLYWRLRAPRVQAEPEPAGRGHATDVTPEHPSPPAILDVDEAPGLPHPE